MVKVDITDATLFQLRDGYWLEWEYRHKGLWAFYYKSMLVIAFLIALPFFGQVYMQGNLYLGKLGTHPARWALIIVPVIAACVAHFSDRVLRSEYSRFRVTNDAYREVLQTLIERWDLYPRYEQKFDRKEMAHFPTLMLASFWLGAIISALEVLFLVLYQPATSVASG